jgi:hypothetical protein
VFQSFLPLHNPLGFGAADFVELALALMLVLLTMSCRGWLERTGLKLAEKTWLSMALLAILPVALRLILLPDHRIPSPDIYDEFGHLFVADTLRHFRFANPSHPLHQFFETFFILQQPTYSSIYPLGQGIMLAIGQAVFGTPWAGVVFSTAAFCSLCYWMLRAWVTPGWALIGGLLAIFEFGPLSGWMNNYWGGAFGATLGCLVFGSLPRLMETGRKRYAILLAAGLGLHVLLRPYESLFLLIAVALYLLPALRRREDVKRLLRNAAPAIAASLLLALGITMLQNKSVTDSWTTLPYQLSQHQYGVPAGLTFQPNPTPHSELTPQQEMEYKSQLAFRSNAPETIDSYLERLRYRIRYYRFFFLPPLYLAILAFLAAIRNYRFVWVCATIALFALGTNFFPAFQLHYVAAVTCLFVLVSVAGCRQISQWNPDAARLLVFLCVAHFTFWYAMHLVDGQDFSMDARRYETWDGLNHCNPERRLVVNEKLAAIPGKLIVFVRYWPQHIFQEEWVYNEADIDHARVIWARDLGEPENKKLRDYYPDRAVWLLEPDARPPALEPYQAVEPPPATPTVEPTEKDKRPPTHPELKFENVPR